MYFEWDANKNRINQRRHRGIDFALALRVFSDPNVLIEEDRVEDGGEVRLHPLGRMNQLILLVSHPSWAAVLTVWPVRNGRIGTGVA